MAKKSNKTEHVLKLITKSDDDVQDDLFQLPQELAEIGSAPAPSTKSKSDKQKKPQESEKSEAPAALEPQDSVEPETEEPEPELLKKLEPEPELVSKPESVQKTKPEPEQPFELNEPDREGSAAPGQHDHLINLAEILVNEKIGLVMEKMKVCSCKTCVNDVLALTLNLLPTKYVTIDKSRQPVQLETYKKQYETDILAALTKACVRVKASPRHERMR